MTDPKLERLSHDQIVAIIEADILYAATNGAEGTPADLSAYRIEGFDFSRVRIFGLHAHRSHLIDCTFDAADLSAPDFAHAVLSRCSFQGAQMRKAQFYQTDLRGCRFDGAYLARSEFIKCDFRGASLRGVDLGGATLSECMLDGADLTGADLSGALVEDNTGEFTS